MTVTDGVDRHCYPTEQKMRMTMTVTVIASSLILKSVIKVVGNAVSAQKEDLNESN